MKDLAAQLDLRPGQSIELLKELHIVTRDGRINQDSRRKLKQVYHVARLTPSSSLPVWPRRRIVSMFAS